MKYKLHSAFPISLEISPLSSDIHHIFSFPTTSPPPPFHCPPLLKMQHEIDQEKGFGDKDSGVAGTTFAARERDPDELSELGRIERTTTHRGLKGRQISMVSEHHARRPWFGR